MTVSTWAAIVIIAPNLGDLLAEVRTYREHDPNAYFFYPGGVQDRLVRIVNRHDWPDAAMVYALALETLWLALPARKGARMDWTAFENARRLYASEELWHLIYAERTEATIAGLHAVCDAAHVLAERDGDPLGHALARFAATLTVHDDAALAAALDQLEAVAP